MNATDIILKYFPDLSADKIQKFEKLIEGYQDWNQKINLVSRTDLENLAERHILHSLAICKLLTFKPFTEIMDLGTGGGFPGLPLAIMYPEVNFTLVDSIGKKIKVVEDLALQLELKNVKAIHSRAEQIIGPFDFVVTRAVAPAEDLVRWTKGKFMSHFGHDWKNGLIMWKGGDLEEELKAVKKYHPKVYSIQSFFEEPFFETKKIVHLPMIGG